MQLNVSRRTASGRLRAAGGFVGIEQDCELGTCARRKQKEKTGVASPYLEQRGVGAVKDRDPRGWSATHVYFALIAERG